MTEVENGGRVPEELRSVGQLNMLHSFAVRLNSLRDVEEIGGAIAAELKTIIDYHNCRVYVLQDDGLTLSPVAFRGELFSGYEQETPEILVTRVGEGITGWAVENRTSLLTPDARTVPFAVTIPGTDEDVLESMLAVPMFEGNDVLGAVVLSMLGYGRFDDRDQRMLEVLASHAAVAIRNARLLEAERESARVAATLLGLSQALTTITTVHGILQEALETVPSIIGCSAIAAYQRDPATGAFRLASFMGIDRPPIQDPIASPAVNPEVAAQFLQSVTEPFILPKEVVADVPPEYQMMDVVADVLVAPLRWEPDQLGVLAMLAPTPESRFSGEDLRLARGITDIASLALGNASRVSELERLNELVDSIGAVLWEATRDGLAFSFLSNKAGEFLGEPAEAWLGRHWGDHVRADDRPQAVAAFRACSEGGDQSIEYRLDRRDGSTVWVRDLMHPVKGGRAGAGRVRGLMFDITARTGAD